MLQLDPSKRITLEQVKEDKWFTEGYEHEPLPAPKVLSITPEMQVQVLDELEEIGLDRAQVKKSLDEGTYDHLTATYYLIADKNFKKKSALESAVKEGDRLVQGSLVDTEPARSPAPAGRRESNVPVLPNITPTASRKLAEAPNMNAIVEEGMGGTATGNVADLPTRRTLSPIERPTSGATERPRSRTVEPADHADDGHAPRPPSSSGVRAVVNATSSASRRRATVSTPVAVADLKKELLQNNVNAAIAAASTSPTSSQPVAETGAPEVVVRARPRPALPSAGRERPSSFAGVPSNQIQTIPTPNEMHTTASQVPAPGATSAAVSTLLPTPVARNPPRRNRAQTVDASAAPHQIMAAAASASGSGSADDRPTSAAASQLSSAVSTSGSQLSLAERLKIKFRKEGQKAEPRVLRFTFSVSTTSTKEPEAILSEVLRVLTEAGVKFDVNGFIANCSYQSIDFEMEVCKLPRLAVNGLRFKRMSGDSWAYKNLLTDLIAKMNL